MYVEVLSLAGFRVEEAENGAEAVAKARRFLPAVIVMDLSLPIVDGWEATRQIKAMRVARGTKIVAISAHAMDVYITQAKEAGADAFLPKPCLPDDLVTAVRKLIALPDMKASG